MGSSGLDGFEADGKAEGVGLAGDPAQGAFGVVEQAQRNGGMPATPDILGLSSSGEQLFIIETKRYYSAHPAPRLSPHDRQPATA